MVLSLLKNRQNSNTNERTNKTFLWKISFHSLKKFLYSDHEIFLRELISNATDATLKLKHLCQIGEAKVPYGNPIIEVKVDKEGKKIHILDQGIGMTEEESGEIHQPNRLLWG